MSIDYTGYRTLSLHEEDIAKIYEGKEWELGLDFNENEYIILYNEDTGDFVDLFRFFYDRARTLKFKPLDTKFLGKIKPLNVEQRLAFDMLQDSSIRIKVLTGPFGCGKTFLMVAHALKEIEDGGADKIFWVRNNIEVKDTAPIGYLPGTLMDKMLPWCGPLIDHLGGEEGLELLLNTHKFEVAHLGHLRGRDIKNSIILCSEAENLTVQQVQLLIGRIGKGSSLWLDGDWKQRDKVGFEKNPGLERAIERLTGNRLFGYVRLNKSERSEAAALADLLD